MADQATPSNKVAIIKNIYLYLVSFVALMMVVFSFADVINIALKTYIFTKADQDFYSYPQPVCTPAKIVDPTATATPAETCVSAADQEKQTKDNREAQRQRDLVRDISMIFVGIPLFAYHWHLLRRKEND